MSRRIRLFLRPLLKIGIVKKIHTRLRYGALPPSIWVDDGSVEDYTIIFPMLKRYNLTGTLAITTGKIGTEGYLSIPQLKEMISYGWEIASHGTTHRNFRDLRLDEARKEMVKSKEWIKQHLGVNPVSFMPPYNEITAEQKKLAIEIFGSVCGEKYHFHSRHWNPEREWDPIVGENEKDTLKRIFHDISRYSPFFRCEVSDLPEFTLPPVPPEYRVRETRAKEVTQEEREAWKKLQGHDWYVPDDALMFLIDSEAENKVVGTEYALMRNKIGTLHAAIVLPEHRKHGFYRYMSLRGIQYLRDQGAEAIELHTGVKILWHFWDSMKFRRVAKVSPHAVSGAYVPSIEH